MFDNGQITTQEGQVRDCIMLSLPERFWRLVDKRPDGCWQWLGSTRAKKHKNRRYRYGTYNAKYAHRLAYMALIGPVPEGLELDHTCQNKLCVNPQHLETVTHQVNCARRPKSGPERSSPVHGFMAYRHGCRCDICRVANTEHCRAYRERRLAK